MYNSKVFELYAIVKFQIETRTWNTENLVQLIIWTMKNKKASRIAIVKFQIERKTQAILSMGEGR